MGDNCEYIQWATTTLDLLVAKQLLANDGVEYRGINRIKDHEEEDGPSKGWNKRGLRQFDDHDARTSEEKLLLFGEEEALVYNIFYI